MRSGRIALNQIIFLFLFGTQIFCGSGGFAQSLTPNISPGGLSRYFLEGILHSRYKQPGWNEFVMPGRIEWDNRSPRFNTSHPRLLPYHLFLRARQRMNRPEFAVYQQMLQTLAGPSSGFTRVTWLAAAAKANAFFYLLKKDPVFLEKSIHILNQLPEPPAIVDWEGGRADRDWGDYLQSAEPIFDLCVTYDWLYAELPRQTRHELERKVLMVTEQLIAALPVTPKNNHVTVMAAAVLTAGLTFDQPEKHIAYDAGSLYRKGWEFLSQSLGLIAPDGGYAEGPYYARYILKYLAPLAFYLRNSVGSRLFYNPRLQRLVIWTLDNHKGSEQFSAFDDSYTTHHLYLPLLRGEMDLPVTTDFYPVESQSQVTPSAFAAEVLLNPDYFAPTHSERVSHNYKGAFYADLGQAIFRNRFPNPDFFATLLFEDPRYFADAHEHVDPLSMEISAFGEDFIIDNGYGSGTGDANRPWFISPEANSAPVVDGYGWNPNPISGDPQKPTLRYGFSTPGFAAVSAGGWNGDVEIDRSIFYPGHQTVIVLDRFSGQQFHRYGSRWHSPILPEIIGPGEVRWTGNGATLQALFSGSSLEQQPIFLHSLQTGRGDTPGAFQMLLETAPARESTTIAILRATPGTAPAFDRRPLLKGKGEWVAISSQSTAREEIAVAHSPCVATDRWDASARLVYLASDLADWQKLLLVDGTRFTFGAFSLESNYPVTLYLENNVAGISGYIHFDQRVKDLRIHLTASRYTNWRVNSSPQPAEVSGGEITIHFTEPGKIEAGFPMHAVEIARPTPPDTPPPILNPSLIQDGFFSDYQKMELYNFTTRAMLDAADRVTSEWGRQHIGAPNLFKNTLNVTQGLLAYGYRANSDGKGIRLPHLYGGKQDFGEYSFSWREEGDWRGSGIDLRYLDMSLEQKSGRGIRVKIAEPFAGNYQSHLHLSLSRRNTLLAGQSGHKSSRLQYLGFRWHRKKWGIRPMAYFRNGALQTANLSLTTPRGGFYGQFSENEQGKFYQTVMSFRWYSRQHIRVETQSYSQAGKDSLDIRFNASGEIIKDWYYSACYRLAKMQSWHGPEIHLAFRGSFNQSWYLYQNFARFPGSPTSLEIVLHQAGESAFWQMRWNTRLEAPIMAQHISVSRSGQLFNNIHSFSGAEWHRLSPAHRREFRLLQSLAMPAGEEWQYHLTAQLRESKQQNRLFLGQGVARSGAIPFAISAFITAPDERVWGLQGNTVFPLGKNEKLQFIGEAYFERSDLAWCLVELNQVKPVGLIPGLRIKYLEPDLLWVNGRLSWRW